MTRAVEDVLEEIGVGDQPRILVLNKADRLDDERRHELAFRHADASLVSAVTGEGLPELEERIADEFERTLRDVELLVPFSEGGTLSELHDVAGDLERTDTPDGVLVTARLPVGRGRAVRSLRGQRLAMRSKLAALVVLATMLAAAAPAAAKHHGPELRFLGQAAVPTGTDVRRDHGRRPVVDHLRPAAPRVLRRLRRREPVPAGAVLHGRARRPRRPPDRR